MVGIINFLREASPVGVVGKLFYLGGEDIDDGEPLSTHYLNCSNPDVSPDSCSECGVSGAYSDGSFVKHDGDNVYDISVVESTILDYYNRIAPAGWDQSGYRPYRWETTTNKNSATKYKTVKVLVDKDDDLWYILAELKEPIAISSTYLDKLRGHFEDD